MDVNVSLPKAAVVAIAAIAIVFVVLLAWIGGEEHYGNCLEKASLQHPATLQAGPAEEAARADAISSCSRWP